MFSWWNKKDINTFQLKKCLIWSYGICLKYFWMSGKQCTPWSDTCLSEHLGYIRYTIRPQRPWWDLIWAFVICLCTQKIPFHLTCRHWSCSTRNVHFHLIEGRHKLALVSAHCGLGISFCTLHSFKLNFAKSEQQMAKNTTRLRTCACYIDI